MERSKGLILIVVGLAAILIIWQVGFNKPKETTNTPKQPNDSKVERPTRQPASGNIEGRIPAQQPETAANADGQNPRTANASARNQGRNNGTDGRNPRTMTQNVGLKIAIPEKMETAQLRVLYDEYNRIRNAVMGGRGSRGGRNGGGRGGMMGGFGGDMGGMMGGFGGDMGGMMGGYGGDMGGMMGGFGGDMGGMMGGFGGDMGGMMGGYGGDMGMAPNAGMDMGVDPETDTIDDSENNF